MQICNKDLCTGCKACYFSCEFNAIEMIKDQKGFLYPRIITDKCISCNKCINICHINNRPIINKGKETYACWLKNSDKRRTSTSGGVFSAFAEYIIQEGGVVYGVGFDEDLSVIHKRVDNINELQDLKGSKYVQSDMKNTYIDARNDLNNGLYVLFTGTPCQIAGLINFLGRNYDNLISCDLICHGVPSPKVYKSYINYMENKFKSKIKNIHFRDKKLSWKWYNMRLEFCNGKVYTQSVFKDYFHVGFLKDLFLRESCHHCKYANTDRVSDISIADFWGYKQTEEIDIDDDKGISMIILNSDSGRNYLTKVIDKLECYIKPYEMAVKGQPCLNKPSTISPDSEIFWNDYNNLPFEKLINKYMNNNNLSFEKEMYSRFTYKTAMKIIRNYYRLCRIGIIIKKLIKKNNV